MGKDLDVIGSWVDGPGLSKEAGESTLSMFLLSSNSSSELSDRYPMKISFVIVSNVGCEGLVLGSGSIVTSGVDSGGLSAFGRRKLCIVLALLLLQVEYSVLLILLD